MVLALIGSGGVAALVFAHHYSELAVYTVAGAGLAAVIHRIWRLLTYVGDWCVRQIQESRGGR